MLNPTIVIIIAPFKRFGRFLKLNIPIAAIPRPKAKLTKGSNISDGSNWIVLVNFRITAGKVTLKMILAITSPFSSFIIPILLIK